MRRLLGLLAAWAITLALAGTAHASITIALLFDDSGTNTLTLSPDEIGQQVAMDVVLRTSVPLIFQGSSVKWDTSTGLLAADATDEGFDILLPRRRRWTPLAPGVTIDNGAGTLVSFDHAVVPLPNRDFPLPPGTYQVGEILWDTSGLSPGSSTEIVGFIFPGLDATGAVIDGEILDVTGKETFLPARLDVAPIPEPASPILFAAGFAVVASAVRARREQS